VGQRATRIGVTGHRWFDDVDGVAAQVDAALAELRRDSDAPIEVWSSLAEGADRLVVERAQRIPKTELVVVLPLDTDDYENDFGSPESVDEFRRLLGSATSVSITGPDDTGSRTSAYERAGRTVVDAVDALIAVWDGEPARGRGGTGEIVDRAQERIDTIVIPVTRSESPS
jgi:hypothetical protein